MGQQEVYDFLKRKRKPYSSRDIAKGIDRQVGTVQRCLNRLVKSKEVRKIKVKYFSNNWKYEVIR